VKPDSASPRFFVDFADFPEFGPESFSLGHQLSLAKVNWWRNYFSQILGGSAASSVRPFFYAPCRVYLTETDEQDFSV
jgi:hypothetical protein